MEQRILIIGAGEIGRAISEVLKKRRDVVVNFWDKNSRLSSDKDLGVLVKEAQFVFLCAPSPAIVQIVQSIGPYFKRGTLVISLTKGMDKQGCRFSSEILRQQFSRRYIAILGGPMIAEELGVGKVTKATVGSTKYGFKKLSDLFTGTNLHLEYSSDIQGISVAGVLKNIYAMGLGMMDALELGFNAKGAYMNAVLLEMELLIKKLGGKSETAYMLAGLGDLEATGHSPCSANWVVGQRIVAGKPGKSTGEGLLSMEPLVKRLGARNLPPALVTIRKSIKNPKKAREFFEHLIKEI